MSRETSTRRRFLKLGGVALTAGVAGCNISGSTPEEMPSPSPEMTNTSESAAQTPQEGSKYTNVYRDTIPSVVMVTTEQGQGTGFVYDESHIVTNAHVVGVARTTQIRYHEGTWASGTVQGSDPYSDLAVITVDSTPDSAQPLSLIQDEPVIGQEVVAIGNPYNLNGSLTTGVVSGLDRLIPSPAGYQIPDAIQTDAAVNPGNSGGPLMFMDGTVLGVVNSKRGDNIAFGISAALTRRVVSQLIQAGEYEHSYMGVALENVTPTIAQANELDEPRGLLVVQTVTGGPAEGILQSSSLRYVDETRVPVGGDILLTVDGTTMSTFEDLASYLALQTQPGDSVTMSIFRDGTEQTVDMTLSSRPEQSQSALR